MILAHHQIYFNISKSFSFGHYGWTLFYRNLTDNVTTTIFACTSFAFALTVSEMQVKGLASYIACLLLCFIAHIQAHIVSWLTN
jgi:hypothetical protein